MTKDIKLLVTTIGDQLGYKIDAFVNALDVVDMIYSGAARMALSSLWDASHGAALTITPEHFSQSQGTTQISLEHLRDRLERTLLGLSGTINQFCYLSIKQNLHLYTDGIVNSFIRSGYVYHNKGMVQAAVPSYTAQGNITLCRGMPPVANLCMSGCGIYLRDSIPQGSSLSFEQMFNMPKEKPRDLISRLTRSTHELKLPSNAKFFDHNMVLQPRVDLSKTDHPYKEDYYWSDRPCPDGRIGLVRFTEAGQERAALYQFKNASFTGVVVPDYLIQDFTGIEDKYDYRYLANAVMLERHMRPAIKAKVSRHSSLAVTIETTYPLGLAEQNFLMLYSWPEQYPEPYQLISPTNRCMDRSVYRVFMKYLKSMGYTLDAV